MAATQENFAALVPTCMESVNRIAKLPVVESSIQAATNIYEKVKEYNGLTQWTCNTAENVVHKAVEVGKPIATPIVNGLERPIRKVDGILCSGIDYIEEKVPAVKLPPSEIICQVVLKSKDYINNTVTPAVEAVYAYVEPTVKSAYEKIEPVIEPAVEKAKTLVEPVVEKALNFVEPAIEKAKSIVEPAVETFKEYCEKHHCSQQHSEGQTECEECQKAVKQPEQQQMDQQ